jgi:uncharacterized protein (DUF885 family)
MARKVLAMLLTLAVIPAVNFLPVADAARPGRRSSAAATPANAATANDLEKLGGDFWEWRDRNSPVNGDDINRIPPSVSLPPGAAPDWSAAGIAAKRRNLAEFEARWKAMNPSGWPVPQQVDYQLMGSAIARVRWELDLNRLWQRDPGFYLSQTLTALLESMVEPPPFDAERSRIIRARMDVIPSILESAKANLHAVRPFAELAIQSLGDIRQRLQQVDAEVSPMLADGDPAAFHAATERAIAALESYRAWLEQHLSSMPTPTAIGRSNYQFFLSRVALLPYTPEDLLRISREEWERTVAFEQYEQHRDQGLPELSIAANIDEEIHAATQDELAIRKFLEDRGILSVPPDVGHYTTRPAPGYLEALSEFGEIDSFLGHTGVRYLHNPSPDLGFFELATTKDPRPLTVHEGVPGHFFQLTLSRMHQDPIRRHFYDSGSIEGLGFYAEEMMMQAGLFDDRPRARELIYSWMRLRALRVEVDVKLALGEFTIPQAADYLQHYVPMDPHTAMGEAAAFAATPGQAIAYQIGKAQILRFLADAKLKQGSAFDLRAFHDYLWKNGNVPIALLRWEYLGLDDDWRDAQKRRAGAIPSVAEPKPVAKGAN